MVHAPSYIADSIMIIATASQASSSRPYLPVPTSRDHCIVYFRARFCMVYADSGPPLSVEAKGTRIASALMHAAHIGGFQLEAILNIQLDAVDQDATARQSIGELSNQRSAGVRPESMMHYSGTAKD
jgi:hypothetical protein